MIPQEVIEIAKSVCPQPAQLTQWMPVITAIVGTTIGALGSHFIAAHSDRRSANRKAKAVEAAILAEVRGLLRICKERRYSENMGQFIQHLEKLNAATPTSGRFHVRVDDGYNKVFKANLENLGLVPSEKAASLVEFYQLLQAVITDVSEGGAIAEGKATLAGIKETYGIFKAALAVGQDLIAVD